MQPRVYLSCMHCFDCPAVLNKLPRGGLTKLGHALLWLRSTQHTLVLASDGFVRQYSRWRLENQPVHSCVDLPTQACLFLSFWCHRAMCLVKDQVQFMLHALHHSLHQRIRFCIVLAKCRLKAALQVDSTDLQSGMTYYSTMATHCKRTNIKHADKGYLVGREVQVWCIVQTKDNIARHLS